jgi:hypothetical protein
MKRITSLVVLMGATALTACASQGPATSPGTGTGHASVAATAPAAGAAPAAATKITDSTKIPSGYRRVVMNGQERFCRREPVTGSRAQVPEVCLTKAQLDAESDGSQDFMHRMQQGGTTNDRACGPGFAGC